MKRTLLVLATIAGAGWTSSWLAAQDALPPPPVPVDAGRAIADEHVELLTRGPLHEAFAQAVTPPVADGLVIRKSPPPTIDEIPPGQRPTGDDVVWIPGYWGWDDESNDFIWISGIWRAMPPGREWVPGYWTKMDDGYQWISGYWADIREPEVVYLPAPPEAKDAGPTTESPTGSEIWVPGCWIWQQSQYVWRPGYWAQGHPEWMWTNAHYVGTPRGYLYISGYWDFLLPQRGVVFAPVHFKGPVTRTYVYTPRLVINTTQLVDHLFLRPTYRHYYFGDYYAASYRDRGILPWFVFSSSRYGYDPIFSYNRWRYRDDRDWVRRIESRYDTLRDRDDGRPPRTYVDYQRWQSRQGNRDSFLFGSLSDYVRTAGRDLRFRDFSDNDRRNASRVAREMDSYRQRRMELEAQARRAGDNDRGPDRVEVLKPPIGNRPIRTDRNDNDRTDNDRDGRPGREFFPDRDNPRTGPPDRDLLPGRDTTPGRDLTPGRTDPPGRDLLPGRDPTPGPRTGPPGRDVPPGRSTLPERDPTPTPGVGPGRDDRPGRDLLPGRDSPPTSPGISPKRSTDLPKIDRSPLNPNQVAPPRTEPRDRAPDSRPKAIEQTNPKNLPGPLNDIRNPSGRPAPKVDRDRPGPANDIRNGQQDRPKGPPTTGRNDRTPANLDREPRAGSRNGLGGGDRPGIGDPPGAGVRNGLGGGDRPGTDRVKGNAPERPASPRAAAERGNDRGNDRDDRDNKGKGKGKDKD